MDKIDITEEKTKSIMNENNESADVIVLRNLITKINEIISKNPDDKCWSHTVINTKSNSATLIAQMPGEGNRMHYHSDWDEWWYIVKGEWDWWVEGRALTIKQGDVVLIERDKKDKSTASGEGQSIRFAVSREDVEHIYIGDGQV